MTRVGKFASLTHFQFQCVKNRSRIYFQNVFLQYQQKLAQMTLNVLRSNAEHLCMHGTINEIFISGKHLLRPVTCEKAHVTVSMQVHKAVWGMLVNHTASHSSIDRCAAHWKWCVTSQWRLLVIRGGSATSPNNDFTKPKQHRVYLGGVDCYDVWQLFLRTSCVTSVYWFAAVKCHGMNDWWGTGIFKAGVHNLPPSIKMDVIVDT